MSEQKKTEAPKARPKTVEISVEDLKGIAGGVAQVGLNVVGQKAPKPKGVSGDVQEGTGI